MIVEAPEGNETGTRLHAPVLQGSQVQWSWHSPSGPVHHSGIVLGYVPADRPISSVLPDVRMPYGIHPVSNQDRYLVRMTSPSGKRILTPAAHLVERGLLEADLVAPV